MSPAVFVDMVHCLIETAHHLKAHTEISILCAHVFSSQTYQTEGHRSLAPACIGVVDYIYSEYNRYSALLYGGGTFMSIL